MTRDEFRLFAAALKTYYPRDGILPNKQAMELWYKQLQDIPYEIAEIALNKWVAISKWAPTIADMREQATMIGLGDKPLWSDGWEEAIRAIKKYGSYRESEAIGSMSELTRKTVNYQHRNGRKGKCRLIYLNQLKICELKRQRHYHKIQKARRHNMGSVRPTKGYECDEPMALRKGLIGKKHTNLLRCRKQCGKCIAALKKLDDGTKEHV